MSENWYLRTQDDTFGPETKERLLEWAKMGRIQPGQEISDDGENWRPATEIPFLDMRWSIDIGDGLPRGPFNRHAAEALLKSGRLPHGSKLVEVAPPFEEREWEAPAEPVVVPEPQQETVAEEPVAKGDADVKVVEKVVEVPVEVVKEVIKEVPVEKIVEKEVRVEVPVEKIVEKEKIVEVESPELLAKAAALEAAVQAAKAEGEKALSAARKEQEKALSAAREEQERALAAAKEEHDQALSAERAESERAKKELEEAKRETLTLESEIKRLPPNAKEAADTEAAVYWLMRAEADDLQKAIDEERAEAEEAQKRWRQRADRLIARRIEILKRIGDDAKDMKGRALRANPADPRTVQLRQELEALRLVAEKNAYESGQQIKELTRALNEKRTEADRLAVQLTDVKRLQDQIQELRERLQMRERELVTERQENEEFRRNAEATQQALLKRLSELEGGMAGQVGQPRDTKAQSSRFPVWMTLKK